MRSLSQLRERDRFGDLDDVWPRVRAESHEPMRPSTRVAAHASAAVPARVRDRMLDRLAAPTFLVEHAVVEDAADRQLAIHLDGIILEVLVATVAVHDETPVGIALADPL